MIEIAHLTTSQKKMYNHNNKCDTTFKNGIKRGENFYELHY
jgi:hypothetical protein